MTSDTPIEEALAFYANKDNWACWMGSSNYPLSSQAMVDRGHLAREAHAALTASPAAPTDEETGKLIKLAAELGSYGDRRVGSRLIDMDDVRTIHEAAAHLTTQAAEIARLARENDKLKHEALLQDREWMMSKDIDRLQGIEEKLAAAKAEIARLTARLREVTGELERSTLFGTETHREYVDAEARAEAAEAKGKGTDDLEAAIAELWQDILEKDDRTSPAEYPDMCLITFEEFDGSIRNAFNTAKQPTAEAKLAALTAPAHDLDALREAVARIVEWCVKRAIGRPPMPLEEIIQFGTKQLLALPAIRNALARGGPDAQE